MNRPVRGSTVSCSAAAVVLLGLLAVAAEVAAGAPPDPAVEVTARAAALQASGRPVQAVALIDSLERAARGARDAHLLTVAATARAGLLELSGRSAEAEAVARLAIRRAGASHDSVGLARALRWRAAALGHLGRDAEARAEWSRLLAIATARGDREYQGYARLGIAYQDERAGDAPGARRGNEAAAQCFRDTRRPYWEAWAWTALGHLHAGRGEIRQARRAYLEAERVGRTAGVREYQQHAANNLGTLEYVAGDPARALAFFQRARIIGRESGDLHAALNAANNVAIMLRDLGRYDAAAAALDTALAEARRSGFRDLEMGMLMELGEVRRAQGRCAASAAVLREAMARGEAATPKTRMEMVLALAATLGDLDSAAAGIALVERTEADLGSRLPAGARAEAEQFLGEWWLTHGDARRALGRLREAERLSGLAGWSRHAIRPLTLAARAWRVLGRPDSALAALNRASRIWEAERGLASQPEWRERFGLYAPDLHVELALLLLGDSKVADPGARASRAFDAVQPFKARTLLERMRGPEWDRGRDPGTPAATAGSVAAALGDGEVFLDVASGSEATILFVVDRGGVRASVLAEPHRAVAERLRAFTRLISTPPERPGGQAIKALGLTRAAVGGWLLGAIREHLRGTRRVIFSPDGDLQGLPLAALALGNDGGTLLDSVEIAYAPSATVFLGTRRASTARGGGGGHDLLALGGADRAGKALAGARSEVRALATAFADVEAHPEGLPVHDAGRRLAGPAILHFATHGEPDDRRPWRSGLLLGDPARPGGDPWLRAADVARMRLPARLAVLASCSSAGGPVAAGEGVLGLCGAFLGAGVPAVVATLWPVDDRASAALMRIFYRELSRGAPVAGALRRAQLEIRRDPRTSHPAFWAGFVVIGEPDTRVTLRPKARWPMWFAMIAGASVVLWASRRQLRRARAVMPTPVPSPKE